jgi:hypothetical protein
LGLHKEVYSSDTAAYGGREKYTYQTLQEMCLEEEKGAGDGH